jgi:translation initiation factor IF-3
MEDLRVNHRIRIKEVRLINAEGQQIGIMPTFEAMKMAEEQGLDLVEISPTSRPPVCKLMDYGKYKYESEKAAKEAKKKQHVVITKEIKIRPKIDPHDLMIKTKHINEFLAEGCKVRVTIMYRGREMAHQEFGRNILDRIVVEMADTAVLEQAPKMEGMNLSLLLSPKAVKQVPAGPAAPAAPAVPAAPAAPAKPAQK